MSQFLLKPYQLANRHLYGNLIYYQKCGLLFLGSSGCGKSMLSYRLIQQKAQLVADDIITLNTESLPLSGSAPASGRNHMEIYGLGIIELSSDQCRSSAPIDHIFFHHTSPNRIYKPQYLSLENIKISYSFLNFQYPFATDYIHAFCSYFHNRPILKSKL